MTEPADTTDRDARARSRVVFRLLMLVVTGVALYLVLPGLIVMFGSLPQLEDVFPAWFVPIFLLEAAAFGCIWALMRIALHTDKWFDVACAQLTGNALSRALPGGAATGGATMYQMLRRAGFDGATTSTALTAVGLLSTATLFVLPVLALPAIDLRAGGELGAVAGCAARRRPRHLRADRRLDPARLRPRRARRRPVRSTGSCTACCGDRCRRRRSRNAWSSHATSFAPRWRNPGSGRCPPRWATSSSTSSRST